MDSKEQNINEWNEIVRLERKARSVGAVIDREAIWQVASAELPAEPAFRMWASHLAEVWARANSSLAALAEGTDWVEFSADEMRTRLASLRPDYDQATADWYRGAGTWHDLEVEKTRRLVRFALATQQRLVALMVEQGEVSAESVRARLIGPYIAGYLSGISSSLCDAAGIDFDGQSCNEEALAVFREIFGSAVDEFAATFFYRKWAGERRYGDGMMHAIEDVISFRRWERGARTHPRMRFLEHLVG